MWCGAGPGTNCGHAEGGSGWCAYVRSGEALRRRTTVGRLAGIGGVPGEVENTGELRCRITVTHDAGRGTYVKIKSLGGVIM